MRRMRPLFNALTAAMFASSAVATTSVLAADDGGGSTTGAAGCSIAVADAGGAFASNVVVVPQEEFSVRAEGFVPNGTGELTIYDVKQDSSQVVPVVFSSEGRLDTTLSFPPDSAGARDLILSQDSPACSAQADVRILPLTDVVDSKFLGDIKWIYVVAISRGCTAPDYFHVRYCPDGLVTRGQMATFLVRALNLPATSTDYFTDDDDNIHEARINSLRAAGITFGCGGTNFCPDGLVTRGQMASFLVRGFDLPGTGTDYFSDDETNKHEANINRLRASGITFGCGGTNFCPDGLVTRGQMAAFIHRAMD